MSERCRYHIVYRPNCAGCERAHPERRRPYKEEETFAEAVHRSTLAGMSLNEATELHAKLRGRW